MSKALLTFVIESSLDEDALLEFGHECAVEISNNHLTDGEAIVFVMAQPLTKLRPENRTALKKLFDESVKEVSDQSDTGPPVRES